MRPPRLRSAARPTESICRSQTRTARAPFRHSTRSQAQPIRSPLPRYRWKEPSFSLLRRLSAGPDSPQQSPALPVRQHSDRQEQPLFSQGLPQRRPELFPPIHSPPWPQNFAQAWAGVAHATFSPRPLRTEPAPLKPGTRTPRIFGARARWAAHCCRPQPAALRRSPHPLLPPPTRTTASSPERESESQAPKPRHKARVNSAILYVPGEERCRQSAIPTPQLRPQRHTELESPESLDAPCPLRPPGH